MDFVCAENYRPHIPEGKYEAVCTGHEESFCFGKTIKLFLHFKIITPGAHLGAKLFMAFNMPKNRKLALGSRYYKAWVMVNCWKKPTRNAIMSPRIFMNKAYEVQVRTVEPKLNGAEMPKTFHYSIIEQLIRVNAGAIV